MILTPNQLATIDRHLRKENWLLNEDLIAELTDHYVTGLEYRMTTGVAFDAALREVYAGFGGRKGLLKMEEEYAYNQFRQAKLESRSFLLAYLKPPRLVFSLLIFAGLYQLVSSNPIHNRYSLVAGGLCMVVFAVSISTSFMYVINKFRNYDKPKITNNRYIIEIVGVVLLNCGLISIIAVGPETWLTSSFYEQHRVFFTTLTLTISVIYLLSVAEYVRKSLPRHKST